MKKKLFMFGMFGMVLAFSLTGCISLFFPGLFIEMDTSIIEPDGTITWSSLLEDNSKTDARRAATSQSQKTQQVYVWQEQGSEYEYDKAALSRGIAEGIFRYGRTRVTPNVNYRMIEVRTTSTETVNVTTFDEVKFQALYEQYVNQTRQYIRQKFAEVNAGNFVELADTDRVSVYSGLPIAGKKLKEHFAKRLQKLRPDTVLIKGGSSSNDAVIVAMLDDNGNFVCKVPQSTYPPIKFPITERYGY